MGRLWCFFSNFLCICTTIDDQWNLKRTSAFPGRNECRKVQSIPFKSFDQHFYMNSSGHFSLLACQPCSNLNVLIDSNVNINCLTLVVVPCISCFTAAFNQSWEICWDSTIQNRVLIHLVFLGTKSDWDNKQSFVVIQLRRLTLFFSCQSEPLGLADIREKVTIGYWNISSFLRAFSTSNSKTGGGFFLSFFFSVSVFCRILVGKIISWFLRSLVFTNF